MEPQNANANRVEDLLRIIELSRQLSSMLSLPELLRRVVEAAAELTHSDAASILLIDPNTKNLYFEMSTNMEDDSLRHVVIPLKGSIAGWIVSHNEPLISSDTQADPRLFRQMNTFDNGLIRSMMGVPLNFKGETIGALEVIDTEKRTFTASDAETLSILASHAAVAIQNARAYAELAEQGQMLSQFLTTVSHELRTPLTSAKGYLQLMRSGIIPPDQQGMALSRVENSLDTVILLVNNILFLQELELITPDFEPVLLADIAEEAVYQVLPRARERGLDVQIELAPTPFIQGYATGLQRAVAALLDNAIKFSPDGGTIHVRLSSDAEQVRLSVSDPGVGIDPERAASIFDPLRRIEAVGGYLFDGVGLGLPIVKQVVEKHGGTIDVHSESGHGSTFTLLLPLPVPSLLPTP